MNRQRPTILGSLLVAMLLVAAAWPAGAAPQTYPDIRVIEDVVEPCSGEVTNVHVTGTWRENLVVTPSGRVLRQAHFTGTFVADNGRTGTVRHREVYALEGQGPASVLQLTAHWHSNDGGTVALTRFRIHIVDTSDGPRVERIEASSECRGRP
jgi:hypothetical protein